MNPDLRTEYWACLALRHCNGIGPKTWKRMLGQYGSAYDAVQAVNRWAADKAASARTVDAYRSDKWREGARQEWDTVLGAGWEVLPWADERYPDLLREIADPPLVLYALGDLSLLKGVSVGVVGARRCTQHGLRAASHIAAGLSRAGITVASGMAWGIDRQAHMAALDGVGRSIGVLGTGLDLVYPSGNRDLWVRMAASGLLLTEFAPGTPPLAHNFPQRNRIIAGLSRGVVVAEAPEKSGGLITARLALEADREVFAVSGPAGNPAFAGCVGLVEQGARAVDDAEQIIEELAPLLRALGQELVVQTKPGPRGFGAPPVWAMAAAARRVARGEAATGPRPAHTPAPPVSNPVFSSAVAPAADIIDANADPVAAIATPPVPAWSKEQEPKPDRDGLGEDETAVLAALQSLGQGDSGLPATIHIDQLGRSLGWEAQRISGALLLLEMRGLVTRHPGMVYSAA